MAARYWVNDSADGLWNNKYNWATTSGGSGGNNADVPTADDDVYFDGGDTSNCTCNVAISCKSLTIAAAYTGNLDFANSSYSVAISGNVSATGSTGAFDIGNADVTCGGDWLVSGRSGFISSVGSRLTMTGSGVSLAIPGSYAGRLQNLALESASVTATTNGNIQVTLTLDNSTLNLGTTNWGGGQICGDVQLTNGSTLTGSGAFQSRSVTVLSGGSVVSVGLLWIRMPLNTQVSGTYNCTTYRVSVYGSYSHTWKPGGNMTFTGAFESYVEASHTATLTIDNATNNPSLEFRGDVEINGVAAGTFNWTKGTGSITLAGANDQTVDFNDLAIEDLAINKSAGTVTFTGGFITDSLTGTDGDCDFNGQTITVAGNVVFDKSTGFRLWDGTSADQSNAKIDYDGDLTLTGGNGDLLAISNLDFVNTVADSPTATYCNVTNSQRTGTGPDIDASDGTSINSGGNTGWSFGAAISAARAIISLFKSKLFYSKMVQ